MRRALAVMGWIVALAALGFAAWSAMRVSQLESRLRATQARADSASSRAGAVHDSARTTGPAGSDTTLERFWREQAAEARAQGNTLLGPPDLAELRRRGLQNPAQDLRRDLVAHRELIPFQSTEGGFQFFPEQTVLLPGRWVCAYFEDGLVPGYVLLRYEVKPGGKIAWERLDARLLN